MKFKYFLLSVLISFLFIVFFNFGFEFSIGIVLILLLSYPITRLDQDFLHQNQFFRRVFTKTINLINSLFGTKFKGLMLRDIENYLMYVDYGYRDGIYVGKHANPLENSNLLLKYIKEKNESGIKTVSNWLLKGYTKKRNYVIWTMNYRRPFYKLTKGWVSGFYQAKVLRALLGLYQSNKDKKIYSLVLSGLNAFFVDLNKGGLRVKGDVGWWYPEYGQKNKRVPYVLNGMMHCLVDLNYIYKKTRNRKAKKLFEMGLKELKHQIEKYDSGSWVYYDRLKNPSRFDYHKVHLNLLDELYKISRDRKFRQIKNKWKKYRIVDGRFYVINVVLLNILFSVFSLLI